MASESTAGQNGNGRVEPSRHSEGSDPSDATQYAAYPTVSFNNAGPPELPSYAGEKDTPWTTRTPNVDAPLISPPPENTAVVKQWVPIPLRPVFWVPLVLLMAGGGIAFEIALHFSIKNHGWGTKGTFTSQGGFLHYVYTFPPVAISMIFAGLWAWMDIEIRRIQPYVDLAKGNAPPQRSLLLDYTRNHTFYVWTVAARNNHFLVTLASLLVIITFTFQPLSAALFNVQDVFWLEPRSMSTSLASIGLNQDGNFQDLSSFLTAAGYASADVRYKIGDPPFVREEYTIAPFQLPPNVSNGTVTANTTAVRSQPNCVGPDNAVQMDQLGNGSWSNTASFNGCSFNWRVNKTAVNLFGVDLIPNTAECASLTSIPEQFRPVIFWFFTYEPSAMASLSLCSPNITTEDVTASIDIASGNVTSVTPLGPLGSHVTSLQEFPANITGDPLDGRAYNGMFFALDSPDPFQQQRQDAIQLSLPAAVFQAAQNSPEGLVAAFQDNTFANLSSTVYTTYLSLVARTVYFLDFQQPIQIDTQRIHKRLFLSPVATHLLASAMFVLAVFGTILQLWHRRDSSILRLTHAPGTIASAVSLGGKTGLGDVLSGRLREQDMVEALQNKRFRIDTRTMKIIMEGEEGYEDATTPNAYRTAFGLGHVGEWGAGVGRRLSRRLSTWGHPTGGEQGGAPTDHGEAA
ncbi:hypothetical protein BDY19DRAFT_108972 [Irpex rosettiformis]|uniref:Uncharacterized protein n=1 Tax=Irpex rosettiformis TaxID=378272 RepID=A0ACB8U6D7_9APHY|nr:hypothetical protein BDY19DRAFT_108972 [Irpex rosettiformis]